MSNDQILNVQNKQKFGKFEFRKFEFVSDFDIWISNFWNPQNLFGAGYDGLGLRNQRTRHK